MSYENAIYQWRQGERRLRDAPRERARCSSASPTRSWRSCAGGSGGASRRTSSSSSIEAGTGWCLQIAMRVAPEDPWAWEAGVVVDAAFARYLREAADFAGGRRSTGAETA